MKQLNHSIAEPTTHVSPKVLAEAIGVSESTVKRWADQRRLEAERTPGGHRRIAVQEAARFVREAGLSLVRPELLGIALGAGGRWSEPDAREEAAEALYRALIEDRAAEAVSLLVSLYMDGADLGWMFDGPMREALSRIGELWKHAEGGVFLEHRATETCQQALAHLEQAIPEAPPGAPIAVGGGSADDPYRVPSAMAALILGEAGFRVRNLGPGTPVEAYLAAASHYRPHVVWVSFSVAPAEPRAAAAGLKRIAQAIAPGVVVVGGRGSVALPVLEHARIHRLGSMSELAAYARAAVAPPARAG